MIIRPYKGLRPTIGERVFVADNATIIGDVTLGDDVSIWYGTVLRGDVHRILIGARTNIQDNCTIHVTNGTAPTTIADEVSLGHGVIAHGCTVETRCLIGIGATLLDGSVIGEGSLVGARALVTEGMRIPPRSLVLGVPARVVRQVTDDETKRIEMTYKAYLGYKEDYRSG